MVQDDRKMLDRISEVIGASVEMSPGMYPRQRFVDLIEDVNTISSESILKPFHIIVARQRCN